MATMRKDLHHHIKPLRSLSATAISSNTTTAGQIIDTKNFGALEFLIQSSSRTDGTYAPILHEGDDPSLSDATVVDASNLLGTIADATISAANTIKKIGYLVGVKRYVRLSLVSTLVTTGATLSAIAVQANPDLFPAA